MIIEKPLGIKAYGSIPHLPGSRLGPSEDGKYLPEKNNGVITYNQ